MVRCLVLPKWLTIDPACDINRRQHAGRSTIRHSTKQQISPQPCSCRPVMLFYADEARELVQSMLERDPAKRPTAAELLSHPWLMENSRCRYVHGGVGSTCARRAQIGGGALSWAYLLSHPWVMANSRCRYVEVFTVPSLCVQRSACNRTRVGMQTGLHTSSGGIFTPPSCCKTSASTTVGCIHEAACQKMVLQHVLVGSVVTRTHAAQCLPPCRSCWTNSSNGSSVCSLGANPQQQQQQVPLYLQPLEDSLVQRLQRYGTFSRLKQVHSV